MISIPRLLTTATLVGCTLSLSAQGRSCGLWLNDVPAVADTAAHQIYLTLEPEASLSLKGSFRWDEKRINAVKLNDVAITASRNNFVLNDWSAKGNTLTLINSAGKEEKWTLVCSTLPFILLEADQTELYELWKEDSEQKHPGFISVIDARHRTEGKAEFTSNIAIRVRGVTTAGKEKKSFAIELVDAAGEEVDARLLGYRNDGDWILDAMFNDYSRMRNRINFDLWNAIDDLPYAKDNQYQANGTQGEFVEVFMKGKYHGMYCFTDKIDRKKINLKKTKEATSTSPEIIRGLLWKSTFNTQATTLYGYDAAPKNDELVWEKYWEQKYPEDRPDQANFTPIADLIDIMKKYSSDQGFAENWNKKLYEQNILDYVICSQALQWMDNLQKNYYFSVRNITKPDSKILFTPWDLDATLGRDAGGDPLINDTKWMAFGEQLGGINNLIHRLSHQQPNDFATKLNNRWQFLKTHALSPDSIRYRLEQYAHLFKRSGAWEREKALWGRKMADNIDDEIEFICDFLKRNYATFDAEVEKWEHEAYTAPQPQTTPALYIVNKEKEAEFEGNKATVPGTVTCETLEGILQIDYLDGTMRVKRAETTKDYAVQSIKEVVTQPANFNPATGFIPTAYKEKLNFDTQFLSPKTTEKEWFSAAPEFATQRTIHIIYDGDSVRVVGNTDGIDIRKEGTALAINSSIEGMHYTLSGKSNHAQVQLQGDFACLLTLDNARLSQTDDGPVIKSLLTQPVYIHSNANSQNRLSGIYSKGRLQLSGEGLLQLSSEKNDMSLLESEEDIQIASGDYYLFASGFNSKGIYAHHDVQINKGAVRIITTGNGVQADDKLAAEGTRAIMAGHDVSVLDGTVLVKTLGDMGGLGIAALNAVNIEGGELALACFDDPINAVNAISMKGGSLFTTSLMDDGLDTNGSFTFTGGNIFIVGATPNEGAFDNDGKSFRVQGGTIIGIGSKSDRPQADKSTQAALYYKGAGIGAFVAIRDAEGNEVLNFESPAYAKQALVISTPELKKGGTYSIFTGSDAEHMQMLTTLTAE